MYSNNSILSYWKPLNKKHRVHITFFKWSLRFRVTEQICYLRKTKDSSLSYAIKFEIIKSLLFWCTAIIRKRRFQEVTYFLNALSDAHLFLCSFWGNCANKNWRKGRRKPIRGFQSTNKKQQGNHNRWIPIGNSEPMRRQTESSAKWWGIFSNQDIFDTVVLMLLQSSRNTSQRALACWERRKSRRVLLQRNGHLATESSEEFRDGWYVA